MQHFKEFIIKLQTIDIKVNERNKVINGQLQPIKFYDISHENPFLSPSFKNEMKLLREHALTDILLLQREQIVFQLQRLGDLKEKFRRFWKNYVNSYVPVGDKHLTEFFWSLGLHDVFIAPHSYYADHAVADHHLIDDLEDTIRAREDILEGFEAAVSKAIGVFREEKKNSSIRKNEEFKAKPVFKKERVQEFFDIIKDYFSVKDQEQLFELLTTNKDVKGPLLFNGPGNQLADAFKQLYGSKIIVGCNKAELEDWIQNNFQYRDKGGEKHFTQKYLQDIISSNTKGCQSPLFDVKKMEGQFYLSILQKNDKNQKR